MSQRIMFLDLETENHPYYGAVASPRHPDNFVVMNGYTVEEVPYSGEVQCDHYPTKADVPPVWLTIPDDVWLLVCHNAPFEMDWFLVQQRTEIMRFLQRGGRIFCTAYAEYLLSNQLETYPSLDETAPKYGGSHKVDGIKILWNQGVKTSAIDPVLLKTYLAGPEGDVVNTRLTFYGQYAELVKRGMWNMALERMEGLLFNCFAMDSGLHVDQEIAFRQRDEQEAELAKLNETFAQYRTHIPDYIEFNPGSDFHLSAWLFGGPIKYRGRVPWDKDDGSPAYEKADFVKKAKAKDIFSDPELILAPEGCDLEMLDFDHGPLERYKSGKNKGQIKVFREDTEVRRTKWDNNLRFDVGPIVDLSLLPANILKEFKREFAGKRKLMDESPVYSTGKDCLDMLVLRKEFPEHVIDILKKLQSFAKIDKDVGTYYLREEKDDDGIVVKQSGMLQYYVPASSTVYHVLNATATVTSRLSSNRPNMQNIPRGDTSDVKKMFTSRFSNAIWLAYGLATGQISREVYDLCIAEIAAGKANGFIIEADYSALEVVTLAAFSKDTNLTKALLDNIDMHCMRLSQQLGEPYEEVKRKCKDETHPQHLEYSIKRTLIKPKAFAYQYGATAAGIAFATGCTVEEAQAFIDAEKALFPEVESFYDEKITPVVEANTTLCREQAEDGSWRVYKRGFWQSPGGTCYSFRQYEKTEWAEGQKQTYMQFKPTQIRNYPIQGESGFFVQGICGKVIRWLISVGFFGNRVFVINTVHDAIYLDCHWSVLDAVAAGVKQIMESLPQHFNERFGYDLNVPFPAAVEFGRSMHEKIGWHVGVLDEPKIREKLGWDIPVEALAA